RPPRDVNAMSPEELVAVIKEAGIVGMGGAVFPTHVKLSPPKNKPIDAVILNGVECEPYLACDARLMIEKTNQILKGLDIILKIVGAKEGYIAIEDNKQPAIYVMEKALRARAERTPPKIAKLQPKIKVVALRTKYPQGAEKQVIKAILNREVPSGGLPMDVGCIVQNVATAFAIYEAVNFSKPLIERIVTLTGECMREPINVWVRIGTMLPDLIEYVGGFIKEPAKVVVGGPMMGVAQYTMNIPVTKGFSGALFMPKESVNIEQESVCIRCGRCVEACPMRLVPTVLMYRVKKDNFAEAKELGITNCYECGACAYACPAKIPLLDYMKYGKSKVISF
ncbi:MAG: electron transport complex subunit RsxC, partial [Candidatus Omnitrophica bacterium]|nr:electron transport complex subunit RsxC [Candidatus Omnitrophota bacterium]